MCNCGCLILFIIVYLNILSALYERDQTFFWWFVFSSFVLGPIALYENRKNNKKKQ